MGTVAITGAVQPGEARSYRMIPFTVPAGTRRVAVAYTYSGASGAPGARSGNTIDIGIFDARGSDARGFRGWSGSGRSAFILTERNATPGYTPGPIVAGTWHIVLGLYEIAPEGCRYTVTVTLEERADQPSEPVPATGAALDRSPDTLPDAVPGWLRGDLHCHSEHSDGDASLPDILATARALGLDFLAVTDHNTISHH
ncbi:MAG: PHP domain-containing protein, partial [Thermomicrobiales bacterium]